MYTKVCHKGMSCSGQGNINGGVSYVYAICLLHTHCVLGLQFHCTCLFSPVYSEQGINVLGVYAEWGSHRFLGIQVHCMYGFSMCVCTCVCVCVCMCVRV